ncbi:hypothetical protein SCHPADRAFT_752215 [Schizopora paradoxa]|uniref:F-box domain-containing protein n=1 Tax=Schizopora paradoxa TaxID=27342 RepID=A0A0H2RI49_9AGAM|nr:hypothetical protein SCHPADRAFT_752215 [Schizopora paradoxa]
MKKHHTAMALRRVRKFTTAFRDQNDIEEVLKKRARMIGVHVNRQEPKSKEVCAPGHREPKLHINDSQFAQSLFDLPYDVLYLIFKRYQLVPLVEWRALMCTCRFWRSILSQPFLCRVGILLTHGPGLLFTRTSIEFRRIETYRALSLWRSSRFFAKNGILNFRLSRNDRIREIQMLCMATFFTSLPPDVCIFREAHIFLTQREQGADLSYLSDIVTYFQEVSPECSRFKSWKFEGALRCLVFRSKCQCM